MGYYSFYKIIKDIFRTIFGNKILKYTFVFLLVFFILFLFNKNKVSAVDLNYDNTYNVLSYNQDINLPADFISSNYYWFCYISNNTSGFNGFLLRIFYSDKEFTVNNSNGTLIIPSLTDARVISYQTSGPSRSLSNIQTYINSLSFDLTNVSTNNYTNLNLLPSTYNKGGILASNFNIKDSNGNIVVSQTNSYFYAPHFDNVSEIENGYPDGVYISRGDYSENDTLYFHLLKITYTVSDDNETIYYYSPKIFALDKNSKYYYTWENDPNNEYSYYYIPRSALGLDTNSSYLYVLSNSSDSYTNSYGILEENPSNGIYDVIQSNTIGVITSQDSTNDKIQNIDDTLNDDTVSNDTETDIEDSLNFDNQNEGLNNLNGGFFSRLTTMFSNLLGYNLAEDTSVSLPLPNSNKSIVLHSKDIYDNVTGALRLIINAFWIYIFSFYMWKFINKIYIAVSTGNILDTFSSSGEAITNDML